MDPTADKPYLFHLALVRVNRQADPELPDLATEEVLDCQLVGVRQCEGTELTVCPVEHLLLLKGGGRGLPPAAQRLAVGAEKLKEQAAAFLLERVARGMALDRRHQLLASLPEREQFIQRGFNFQETELAAARVKQSEKARSGKRTASLVGAPGQYVEQEFRDGAKGLKAVVISYATLPLEPSEWHKFFVNPPANTTVDIILDYPDGSDHTTRLDTGAPIVLPNPGGMSERLGYDR